MNTEVGHRRPEGGACARVFQCGGKRSATPLWLARPAYSLPSQSAVAAIALPAHSKARRRWPLFFCFLVSAFCFRAWGQSSLDWWSVEGGGGTSSNGLYVLTGSVGQADAGEMSGGNFTLLGGFWGVVAALQVPGGPVLWLTRTETNSVVVSWAAPAEGWRLEATTNLVSTGSAWREIPPPYATQGTSRVFVELAPLGNKFYRLHYLFVPALSVTRTISNCVVVSWPAFAEGWRLEATTNLVTAGSAWTEIAPPYATQGTNWVFVELVPLGQKFYRLRRP